MASLSNADLMRAYYLGALGYTTATGNTQSMDNLIQQFYSLSPPAPSAMQYVTGFYYMVPHGQVGTNIFGANGEVRYAPYYCERAVTISEYAFEITTGGAAGSLARLGIYGMKSDGTVGTLLDDGGTTATDVTGARGVTGRSVKLAPGYYFFAAAQQGGVGTQATFRSVTGPGGVYPPTNTLSATPTNVNVAQNTYITASGVTGALASNPTVVVPSGTPAPPRFQFRLASVP